jgi:hypothetical protein
MFVGGNPISFIDTSGYNEEEGGLSDFVDGVVDAIFGDKKDKDLTNDRNIVENTIDTIVNIPNSVSAAWEQATSDKKFEETKGGENIQEYFEKKYGAYMEFDGAKLSFKTKGWSHEWDSWTGYSGLPSTQQSSQAERLEEDSGTPLANGKWTLSAYSSNNLRNNGFQDGVEGVGGYTYNGVAFRSNDLSTNIAGSERTNIQIHPDGNDLGTLGCIGLRGTAKELRKSKSTIRNHLARQKANGQYYNNSIDVYVDYP